VTVSIFSEDASSGRRQQHDWLARMSAKKLSRSVDAVASEFGIEPQTGELDDAFRRVWPVFQAQIMDLHNLVFDYDAKLAMGRSRRFSESACRPT